MMQVSERPAVLVYHAGMGRYLTSIDDGSGFPAGAEQNFESLEAAFNATLRSAAMIAAEELPTLGAHTFTCEAQDAETSERRRATLKVVVVSHP